PRLGAAERRGGLGAAWGAGADCGGCEDMLSALLENAGGEGYSGREPRPHLTVRGESCEATMCENWGYERLWKRLREESLGEMRHADTLIERILSLEGVPNLQGLRQAKVAQTVPEQLRLDLELERDAIRMLNA